MRKLFIVKASGWTMEPSIISAHSWARSCPEIQPGLFPSYARKDDVSAAKLHSLDRHSLKSIRFSVDNSFHQVDQINSPRSPQATTGTEQIDTLRGPPLPVECHTHNPHPVTVPNLFHARPLDVCDKCFSARVSNSNLPDYIRDGNREYWVRNLAFNRNEYIKALDRGVRSHFRSTFGAGAAASSMSASPDDFCGSETAGEIKDPISDQPGNLRTSFVVCGRCQGSSHLSGNANTSLSEIRLQTLRQYRFSPRILIAV
jgi:hypothetical protein